MNRDGENKKFCTIDSVTIGHRKISQTVIPKVYTVKSGHEGRLHFCDMPGFNETDSEKKISIDVLQKCFLTRVHNAKFLVVADINTLKEAKMTTLMSHYDEPLSQLLGRKYEDGIDHLYFILTKNSPVGDPNRMTEADVERLAFQGAKDFHKTQRTGTQFLYRLSDRFIIVDMEQDNNVTLLNKIQVMIEQDEAEKQNRSAITSFVIDKLQDGEGKLHMKCSARVAELGHEQEEIIKSFTSLRTAVEDARDTILADTQRHNETHRDLLVQEHDTKEELSKSEARSNSTRPSKRGFKRILPKEKRCSKFKLDSVPSFAKALRLAISLISAAICPTTVEQILAAMAIITRFISMPTLQVTGRKIVPSLCSSTKKTTNPLRIILVRADPFSPKVLMS